VKLTLNTFLSLDGVMQGPGGVEEDRSGGFESGGWLVPHVDDDFGRIVAQRFAEADAFLMGRTTYDISSAKASGSSARAVPRGRSASLTPRSQAPARSPTHSVPPALWAPAASSSKMARKPSRADSPKQA
jgi:dihydrofolate reductase